MELNTTERKIRLDAKTRDPAKKLKKQRAERDRGLSLDPTPKERKAIGRELALPPKVKKNQLPAIFVKPPTKRISKLHPNKMKSILGDSAEEIHQLLENDNNDSASNLLQKRLIQATLDMLPYAEHAIRKTKGGRGVYQYNSLITSIRELMIDVQAVKDKGAIGEQLIEKALRPAFTDIAAALMKEEDLLSKFLRSVGASPELLRLIEAEKLESLKRMAHLITAKFEEARTTSIEFLRQ